MTTETAVAKREPQAAIVPLNAIDVQDVASSAAAFDAWLQSATDGVVTLDRIKNYLQKYLPAAQEITEKDVIERGVQPGTPKFAKVHQQMIAARLDARPKKAPVEEPAPTPPGPGRPSSGPGRPPSGPGRRSASSFGR